MRFRTATYLFNIIAACAAIMLYSGCSGKPESSSLDFEQTPMQVVYNMEIQQTELGMTTMRMTAPVMQHFEFRKDSMDQSYDYYPKGIHVDAYTKDGALETTVDADEARHITTPGQEEWKAFGNVQVVNIAKRERMESDTIYWVQDEKRIYTDCYVRISSPQGVMQGYGMESDERANRTILLKPFDSFSRMQDSTAVVIDSANFIGPLKEN